MSSKPPVISSSPDRTLNVSKPLTFRVIPAEIREMIFESVVEERTKEMPALIKALRPDQELYHEALDIFYKKTKIIVAGGDPADIYRVNSASVFSRIVNILIIDSIWSGRMVTGAFKPDFSTLRKIHVDKLRIFEKYRLFGLLKNRLKVFKTLTEVVCSFEVSKCLYQDYPTAEDDLMSATFEDDLMGFAVELINGGYGVQGLLASVDTCFETTWFWKADEGHFLRWARPEA